MSTYRTRIKQKIWHEYIVQQGTWKVATKLLEIEYCASKENKICAFWSNCITHINMHLQQTVLSQIHINRKVVNTNQASRSLNTCSRSSKILLESVKECTICKVFESVLLDWAYEHYYIMHNVLLRLARLFAIDNSLEKNLTRKLYILLLITSYAFLYSRIYRNPD